MTERKLTEEQQHARFQVEQALLNACRDVQLTAAIANYVHTQMTAQRIEPMAMLLSLIDVAAVCMATALIETPPHGNVCDCITPIENYFHIRTHEEIETLFEANKK